jgi:hypothetical protein
MALCSVADVQVFAKPVSVSDAEVTAVIALLSEEIAAKTGGSASSTDTNLKFACIHLSVATVLKKARSNGELAAGVNSGGYSQQNTGLIGEINAHEMEAEKYILRYTSASGSYAFGTGRMGFGTVNTEL